MDYLPLDKPPGAVSDWEKHLASLVIWLEFCLFWLPGWLTAWTAASCLLLRIGTATLKHSVCLNPLLCACTAPASLVLRTLNRIVKEVFFLSGPFASET